jgi:predicted secreted protein
MAITGKGALLRRYNTGSGLWEEFAEVNNISGPSFSRETVDTTHLQTSGGYRTFIPSFRDPGTLSFDANFTRDDFDTLKADFESDTLVNYEVVLNDDDDTSLEFEGMVTEMPLTIPPDDKVTIAVTIKISGEVTVNSGSASGAP